MYLPRRQSKKGAHFQSQPPAEMTGASAFRAVYTEVNARLEAEALRLAPLGQVTFLNDEEAAKATSTNAGVLVRAWDLWKAKALAATR